VESAIQSVQNKHTELVQKALQQFSKHAIDAVQEHSASVAATAATTALAKLPPHPATTTLDNASRDSLMSAVCTRTETLLDRAVQESTKTVANVFATKIDEHFMELDLTVRSALKEHAIYGGGRSALPPREATRRSSSSRYDTIGMFFALLIGFMLVLICWSTMTTGGSSNSQYQRNYCLPWPNHPCS